MCIINVLTTKGVEILKVNKNTNEDKNKINEQIEQCI